MIERNNTLSAVGKRCGGFDAYAFVIVAERLVVDFEIVPDVEGDIISQVLQSVGNRLQFLCAQLRSWIIVVPVQLAFRQGHGWRPGMPLREEHCPEETQSRAVDNDLVASRSAGMSFSRSRRAPEKFSERKSGWRWSVGVFSMSGADILIDDTGGGLLRE
ncbi:hypothetical protein EJ03DRAFT_168796 [Teratosphaeria nubilosa]|uniref:Uncharacterized protein n=1 Tax=Teratosphaeria nubilosa TaxID=161662 RepID=A0A6G1LJA8_9PEZI|nr:hypothetical protein EJ03DRAFT_168796 [Teratosphaeria nubilosa]